jgi:hypothetical protein
MKYIHSNNLDWEGAKKKHFENLSIPQIKNKYYTVLKFRPTEFENENKTKSTTIENIKPLPDINVPEMLEILRNLLK